MAVLVKASLCESVPMHVVPNRISKKFASELFGGNIMKKWSKRIKKNVS